MASFVSIGFSAPLCRLKSPFQSMCYEVDTRRVICGRLRNSMSGRKARRQLFPSSDGSGRLSSIKSWHCSIEAQLCFEPISCPFGVSSPPYITISGYWIGPDVEDGWGFVEASVYRID